MLVAKEPINSRTIPIDGGKLKRLRLSKLVLTQEEISAALKMSSSAYQNLESGRTGSVYLRTLRKIAQLAALTVDQVLSEISPETTEFDQNFDPYGMQRLLAIPQFDLSIAAGGWESCEEIGELNYDAQQSIVNQKLFRVKIRGDSMEKKWKNGSVVEFRNLKRDGSEPLEIGKDYCCIRNDNCGTFKTLVRVDEDSYTFSAINRKYREKLTVERSCVTAMAKAVARVEIID